MKAKEPTPEEVYDAAVERVGSHEKKIIDLLIKEYLSKSRFIESLIDNEQELAAIFDTVVACLVEQMGGEARIDRASLEHAPRLYQEANAETGEWIYATRGKATCQ